MRLLNKIVPTAAALALAHAPALPAIAADAPWFLPYAQICSTANHQPARVALSCTDRGEQPRVQAPGQAPADAGACQTDIVFPGYNLRFAWAGADKQASCLCLDESGAWITYLKMSAQAGRDGWLDRDWYDLGAAGKCATRGAVQGSR